MFPDEFKVSMKAGKVRISFRLSEDVIVTKTVSPEVASLLASQVRMAIETGLTGKFSEDK